MLPIFFFILGPIQAQTVVNTLAELRAAVQNSNQNITMTAGNYNIEVLTASERDIRCSGSNNTIDLTGVYIDFPVGSSELAHFLIEGDNVTLTGGTFENTYYNDMTEVTDFEAYNNDRTNLAYGADPHIKITGDADGTTIIGTKMTVRGSFPYGYGSLFGIGAGNTYGLDKRAGIQINGPNTVIDGCEVQMQVFGHGIFIGEPAANTIVKNCLVEGVVRHGSEILAEGPNSLPGRNGYKDNDGNDINPNDVISLCEDGIRMYNGGGSATVENCTVKKMRGGIKLYLSSESSVSNSTSIDCGDVNFNMSNNGVITNSFGNFAYEEFCDFAGNKSGYDAEWTILPSPHAVGTHNIADVKGNGHKLVFHRADGPLDTDEERAIVVTGSSSRILNETEYTIVLEASAEGNTIINCGEGQVIDNGTNNIVIESDECEFPACQKTVDLIQAECFDSMSGIENEGENIGFINNDDWVAYTDIDLTNMNLVEARASSKGSGGDIEVRLGSTTGTLIGTIPIAITGNWNNYQTTQAAITSTAGVHDLYLVFTGSSGYLFNLDWVAFDNTLSVADFSFNQINLFPNPATNSVNITNARNTSLKVYNIQGVLELKTNIVNNLKELNIEQLSSGVHFLKFQNEQGTVVKKLIKN